MNQTIMLRIPRLTRRLFSRFKFGKDSGDALNLGFFPQQRSCQVPTLWFLLEKYFGRLRTGTYVEVGAYDGIFVSNTWGLATVGWRGFLIEPIPQFAQKCRDNYRALNNIKVCQEGIGASDCDVIRLRVGGTLTTSNQAVWSEYANTKWASASLTANSIEVPSRTLDAFLQANDVTNGFELLVVDVEGSEALVFSGFSLETWRPKMMIVELANTHPDLQATSHEDGILETQILDANYRIVYKDSINTVFVRIDVWEKANT